MLEVKEDANCAGRPESVYEELVVRGAGKPGSAEIRDSSWIEVRSVTDREKVIGLQQSLGLTWDLPPEGVKAYFDAAEKYGVRGG